VSTHVTCVPLDQANDALISLKERGVRGAYVLQVGQYS
jgi:hypothetical protein